MITGNDANNNGTGTFTITPKTVTKDIVVVISAKTPDPNSPTTPASTRTVQLTVQAPGLQTLNLSANNVIGGQQVTNCWVGMNTAASTNTVVTLTSSNPAVATLPKTVTVFAGSMDDQLTPFTINTVGVSTDTNVVITATANGKLISQTLLVKAPTITTVTPLNWELVGGSSSVGTITLSSNAPLGGVKVTMTSDFPTVVIPPAGISIPYGRNSYPFNINTAPVAAQTIVTVNLVLNGQTTPVQVIVDPPSVVGFTLSPTLVAGTAATQATITLNGPAPAANQLVTLTSANGAGDPVKLPTVSVLAGQKVVTKSIPTLAVSSDTTVQLYASTAFNVNPVSASLTVQAPKPQALVLSKSSVVGGQTVTGILTLTGPAPSSGLSFTLASTNAAVIPPVAVNVLPGATQAQVTPITTAAVSHGYQWFDNGNRRERKCISAHHRHSADNSIGEGLSGSVDDHPRDVRTGFDICLCICHTYRPGAGWLVGQSGGE